MTETTAVAIHEPEVIPASSSGIEAFTFGEPAPVLSQREIFDYLEAMHNGRWYEPPLSPYGLAKVYRAAVHHASAIQVKRNILRACFIPHRLLNTETFSALMMDFLIFGNGFLRRRKNRLGGTLTFEHLPSKYTRVGVDLNSFWWVPNWSTAVQLPSDEVFHVKEYDINQQVYGIPDYTASMNSSLLNESATLFRRKYYENGSHAGYILYLTDALQNEGDVAAIRTALKNAKGPGNFRNLFLYAPGGNKDGIRLIPVAEVAAKDDFLSIKNVSRDDQLAAHRVPPQLMGVMPNNTGGFGDANKAAQVFDATELESLRALAMYLNDWAGETIVQFNPYALAAASPS